MAIAQEQPSGAPKLVVSREPVGPRTAGDKGSPGDKALMDAVAVIVIAWVVLAYLVFSLRTHNV